MDYEEKLKQYIKDNGIQAEHLHFERSVHTVEEAAAEANAKPGDFVKSVCLTGNKTVIAIILGTDRADIKKAEALTEAKLHLASPEEALQETGYPVGGTPPFGYSAIFLMDEKVLNKSVVYAGGGSPQALIKISPDEIIRISKAQVADIRK